MAADVKRKTTYASYGNVAYEPSYAPEREGEGQPVVRPRERVKSRTRVMVRPAGYVSPTAVIGFAAVVVLAVMILFCYVDMTAASNDIVRLRNQSAALEKEHSQLLSEYELAFDLKTVEEVATTQAGMTQPQPGQEVTMDLSEPDSAQVYEREEDPLSSLWDSITETVGNIVEFFQ